MPKYRLTSDHYLQAKKRDAKPTDKNPWAKEPQAHLKGDVIDWDGKPSLQMEPMDKEATERVDERRSEWKAKKEAARQNRSQIGWSSRYATNFERMVTHSTPADADPTPATGSRRTRAKAA